MTSELTPYGIYVSAAYHMDQHPILNIAEAIVCGGWSFEFESCLFHYITKIFHVSQDVLVLGNHAYPKTLCPMYSIDCIFNDKNRMNIHHYITYLFGTNIGGAPVIFTIKTYLFTSLL